MNKKEKEEYKIVKVTKTSGSSRKDRAFKRSSGTYNNVVRLTVPFTGNYFIYTSKEKGEYNLCRKDVDSEFSNEDFLHERAVTYTPSTKQKSLNVRAMYEPGTYVSTWYNAKRDIWKFTIATEEEIKAYATFKNVLGGVTRAGSLYIGKKRIQELTANGRELICELVVKDKCYMNLLAVSKEEAATVPTLRGIVRDYDFPDSEIIRYKAALSNLSDLYLPAAFFNAGNIKRGETLAVYPIENGLGYCIDVDPIVCELCGHIIKRRVENVATIDVTSKEKASAENFRNVVVGTCKDSEPHLNEHLDEQINVLKAMFTNITVAMKENQKLLNELMM